MLLMLAIFTLNISGTISELTLNAAAAHSALNTEGRCWTTLPPLTEYLLQIKGDVKFVLF